LYEDGIGASLFKFFQELTGVVELVIVDDSVDRDIDLRPKGMGITAELGNVGDRVACCHPGPETGSPNINGISTVVDSRDAACEILGRSQQFYLSHKLDFGVLTV
jgi:hypothetical protein